ncbi:carbon-nitrogen hydrolase family protein [candidate division KSB1 bacterium]
MSKEGNVTRRNFLKKSGVGLGSFGLGISSSGLHASAKDSESPVIIPEKLSPREAWVMSIVRSGLEKENMVEGMIERIRIMSSYKPDIICLPEVFTYTTAKTAEEVPGPLTNSFSKAAKEIGSYIICPLHTKKNGKVYNSAVVIGRKGEIVGQYDKIHPVSVECEAGVSPGSYPPPVFKTDVGTIGIQICFDINWIEEWKSLKEQGAEIVFWPSAYPAGRNLQAYAWMFKYYVVGCSWRDPATIYDMTGDLISQSGQWQHWAFGALNLEKVFFEIANYSKRLNDIKKKYGRKVLITYLNDEDWVTLESRSPDVRVKDIYEEYELVPHWDYIKLETKLQDNYR